MLREVERTTDVHSRLRRDPVSLLHEIESPLDQELAGIVISALAFGNAGVVVAKGREVLRRVGSPLALRAEKRADVLKALRGFRHRLYGAAEVAGLLAGARRVQKQHGTLGDRFADLLAGSDLRTAMAGFVREVRSAGGLDDLPTRGAAHILPSPEGASASKRLCLYLRWMVRRNDGVDLGLWTRVSPSVLLVPMDVHLSRLSRNVGLTDRKGASWALAEEVTAKLRLLDESDPVRFDFPLCHLGMAQGCPSRRDVVACEGCGVRPICRHWAPVRRRGP